MKSQSFLLQCVRVYKVLPPFTFDQIKINQRASGHVCYIMTKLENFTIFFPKIAVGGGRLT